MKAKVIAITLGAVLAMSFAACGNDSGTATVSGSATGDEIVSELSEQGVDGEVAEDIADAIDGEAVVGQDEDGNGIGNPITEYDSIDAMNEAVGGSDLYCPNDVAENQIFDSINMGDDMPAIAEYQYSLDGTDYDVRYCSDFNAAISGIYLTNGEEAFSDSGAEDWTEFSVIEDDGTYVAHWLTVEGQYVFAALDTDMTLDAFTQIAQEYMDGTIPAEN